MLAPDSVRPGHYDFRPVALSVFISILAAYAAHDLSERVRKASRPTWLARLVMMESPAGPCTTGESAFGLPVPDTPKSHSAKFSLSNRAGPTPGR